MRDRLVRHSLLVVAVLASTATASAMDFSPDPGADAAVGDTLRAAILAANATPEDDLITLVAGTYDISLLNGGVQENLGNTGDLDVLQGSLWAEEVYTRWGTWLSVYRQYNQGSFDGNVTDRLGISVRPR